MSSDLSKLPLSKRDERATAIIQRYVELQNTKGGLDLVGREVGVTGVRIRAIISRYIYARFIDLTTVRNGEPSTGLPSRDLAFNQLSTETKLPITFIQNLIEVAEAVVARRKAKSH